MFLGTHLVLQAMLDAGRGAIVNMASAAALVGVRDRAAYSASKGTVVAFTRQVAVQYAGTGVRFRFVCPGALDSPWIRRVLNRAKQSAPGVGEPAADGPARDAGGDCHLDHFSSLRTTPLSSPVPPW